MAANPVLLPGSRSSLVWSFSFYMLPSEERNGSNGLYSAKTHPLLHDGPRRMIFLFTLSP